MMVSLSPLNGPRPYIRSNLQTGRMKPLNHRSASQPSLNNSHVSWIKRLRTPTWSFMVIQFGHSWSLTRNVWKCFIRMFLFQRPTDRMTSRPISESQDRLAGGPGTEPGTDSSLRRKKSDTRVRYPMIVPNDENSNGPSTNSEVLYLICIVFYAFLHHVRIFWDLFQKFRVHPR